VKISDISDTSRHCCQGDWWIIGGGTPGDQPSQYLDMSCCAAKIARMNVPFLSLKIISGGKQKKGQEFSRLLTMLSFHQKCSGRLKMHQIYFRKGLHRGPCWESLRYPLPIPNPDQNLRHLILGACTTFNHQWRPIDATNHCVYWRYSSDAY